MRMKLDVLTQIHHYITRWSIWPKCKISYGVQRYSLHNSILFKGRETNWQESIFGPVNCPWLNSFQEAYHEVNPWELAVIENGIQGSALLFMNSDKYL